MNLPLLWVVANNRKTGAIPSAYVGSTVADAWASCDGCALRDSKTCYAWVGLNGMIFKGKIVPGAAKNPGRYSLSSVLASLRFPVFAARLGVLGDPSRVLRSELLGAIAKLRSLAISVLGYTHFWRERANAELRHDLMASCNDVREADEALALGWRPAAVLPWHHEGKRFETPGGAKGLVCPAQTKDKVTCESCRLCDPRHPVWSAGKIAAIGFVNHSPSARASRGRSESEKTIPLFGPEGV